MKSVRYIITRNAVRMTWLGPAAGYLVFASSLMPYSAPLPKMVPILGVGSLLVGAWLSVISIDGDDPTQKSVVALASGGRLRARCGEATASYLFVTVLSVIGLGVAFSRASPAPSLNYSLVPQLAGSALALGSAGLAGVALGYLFAWPVLQRTPLTLCVALLAAFTLLLIPGSPMSELLAAVDDGANLVDVAFAASGLILIAAACIGVGSILVVRRWRLTRPA